MRDVSIIGAGQVTVGELWDQSLKQLAYRAIRAALDDARAEKVDMLYVSNMLAGTASEQAHLGALVADFAGLHGVEAVKIEAACASGGAALRQGYLAAAGGLADFVMVCGVEKMTDHRPNAVVAGLAMAADADYEVIQGLTFAGINALMMRRYMYEYNLKHDAFAPFAVNAHRNAATNPYAMFPEPVTTAQYTRARMITPPINLLDSSPICDGAAAVLLCPTDIARDYHPAPVRIKASASATDTLAVHSRRNPTWLAAAESSARQCYAQAGVGPDDIDFFELHDAFVIMSALSLEAAGFAARGEGTRLALAGEIFREGRIPICTMGGLKARGHPVGATGVYQAAEATLQLRGQAGENQIPGARLGMIQNIGGSGATIVAHILEAS
ncbi:MAG: thiolase domain-containing protein [Anaerolineae bacterium]|nr:thiolase domain-containing protein [Anaerolineae bacterium]